MPCPTSGALQKGAETHPPGPRLYLSLGHPVPTSKIPIPMCGNLPRAAETPPLPHVQAPSVLSLFLQQEADSQRSTPILSSLPGLRG